MKYWIHWIDVYKSGYRMGVTHASISGEKSLCGINYSKKPIDGGYQTTEELKVECKKCLKQIHNGK